ncbi:MAG: DUF1761 domain-containing protein [Boseongicola sp.]|nr:DUF1761 domain-containing protein [Boseongicola sp.]
MPIDFASLNWLAILACVLLGQIFLTVWFAVLFADPWAKAYGAADKAEHTKAIPAYTYGIGLICMILLVVGLALVQQALGIVTLGAGLTSGGIIAICFAVATALPGYAFLARYDAAKLAIGSQVALILILSAILGAWS